MRYQLAVIILAGMSGCFSYPNEHRMANQVVPAVEFSKAVKQGTTENFSINNIDTEFAPKSPGAVATAGSLAPVAITPAVAVGQQQLIGQTASTNQGVRVTPVGTTLKDLEYSGDPRYLAQGLKLRGTVAVPSEQIAADPAAAPMARAMLAQPELPPPPAPPPGSSAPYYMGQMTSNPSLWPDEGQGGSMFRDIRAYQSMDVLTIVLNETSQGEKKTATDSQSKYSLVAAIKNLFGEETHWKNNTLGLDPSNLINASTDSQYTGTGDTKREGTLKASLAAVVLEVLPNGLLRVEGTKIISVDHEEEVMVISGLVRPKDVDANNAVDSSRIANMRVDYYGRGVVGESTFPGWAARGLRYIWPF